MREKYTYEMMEDPKELAKLDFFVLFDDPNDALLAAFEAHHRIRMFNRSELASENPAHCCIGIGYGEVYAIGVDHAMGDEIS